MWGSCSTRRTSSDLCVAKGITTWKTGERWHFDSKRIQGRAASFLLQWYVHFWKEIGLKQNGRIPLHAGEDLRVRQAIEACRRRADSVDEMRGHRNRGVPNTYLTCMYACAGLSKSTYYGFSLVWIGRA